MQSGLRTHALQPCRALLDSAGTRRHPIGAHATTAAATTARRTPSAQYAHRLPGTGPPQNSQPPRSTQYRQGVTVTGTMGGSVTGTRSVATPATGGSSSTTGAATTSTGTDAARALTGPVRRAR